MDVDKAKFLKDVEVLKTSRVIVLDKEIIDNTGVNKSALSTYLNPVSEAIPSRPFLKKFYEYYGKHLKQNGDVREPLVPYGNKPIGIPFYEVDVTASPMVIFNDGSEYADFFIDVPMFRDCSFAVRVYGESMRPAYNNGEVVACKKITDKEVIFYGETYLVITKEMRTIKCIRKHKQKEYLILSSANSEFDPVEIHRDKIIHLFLVKGKIAITNN
jgi:repressor LexA